MAVSPSHRVNHLLITVGGNPLPCAVAGRLLLTDGGTIHLIYSAASKSSADSLCAFLGISAATGVSAQGRPLIDSDRRLEDQVIDCELLSSGGGNAVVLFAHVGLATA